MKKIVNILASVFCLVLVPSILYASEGGGTHLPDVIGTFFHHGLMNTFKPVIFAFSLSIFFSFIALKVYKNRQMIPGPLQNLLEMLIEGMYNFIETILGKDTRQFIPFLGTLFFYILGMNLMGLIPGGAAPTTSLAITASLAVLVFFYSQYTGIARLGIWGYIDHLMGEPRDVIGWCLVPLMLPMHIIGEFAKPFSLALRLFGNITGEDILVGAFVGLGISALAFIGSPVGLPLNIPFILLGMLLSTIQALVFTLLSTIYILMMLPHEEAH